MGLNYDQWMNVSAGVGMMMIFFCYWVSNSRRFGYNGWSIYIGKFIGFGLVMVPLFSRWFLSESLILLTSSIIVLVSSFFLFLRKKGV